MKQFHPSVLAALYCLCLAALSRTPLRESIGRYVMSRRFAPMKEPASLACDVEALRRAGWL